MDGAEYHKPEVKIQERWVRDPTKGLEKKILLVHEKASYI